MQITIDVDELVAEAFKHMQDGNDLRWSVGMALQELYWDRGWDEVQQRMIDQYNKGEMK
jgi:hypothetical protein